MFSHYFGNHLLNSRLITAVQLKEILSTLDSVHVKLGMLAMEAGLLNALQIKEVHALQMIKDNRFGEIAIALGYLTPADLDDLLGKQNKRHLALSQALLDKKWLSFEQLELALADFKAATALTDAEIQALKDNDVDAVVAAFFRNSELSELTSQSLGETALESPVRLVQDYVALLVRNLVRFVTPGVVVSGLTCVAKFDFEYCVGQQIDGSMPLYAGLCGSGPALAALGGGFAHMPLVEMDALAKDAVGELLNCHNGLFLAKLSNEGLDLELSPPLAHDRGALESARPMCVIPITLPTGGVSLVFAWGAPAVAPS